MKTLIFKQLTFFIIVLLTISDGAQEGLTKPVTIAPKDPFIVKVEKVIPNANMWNQPYRYEDKNLKPLSLKISIEQRSDDNEVFDFNKLYLTDETNKLRIRPNALYYHKAERRVYYRSKPVNQNYNHFRDTHVDGYTNFEAETYRTNFLGMKKKRVKSSIQELKKQNIKLQKIVYFVDFPVYANFSIGTLYFDGLPSGEVKIPAKPESALK